MVNEWSELAELIANLIEKYASDLDIDNMRDIEIKSSMKIGERRWKSRENKGFHLQAMLLYNIINVIKVSKHLTVCNSRRLNVKSEMDGANIFLSKLTV